MVEDRPIVELLLKIIVENTVIKTFNVVLSLNIWQM